ncbi:MAG: EAL domain-containing protein [Lachnospiraceae bacterium]|nr:EAL domain-containing protein [Lachnospiraceae bacterium]
MERMNQAVTYFESYTPAADIVVVAVCLVFIILIKTSFINKTKTFNYLLHLVWLLVVAAITDMLFHISMNYVGSIDRIWNYVPRFIYHTSLYMMFLMYIFYAIEALSLDKKQIALICSIAGTGFLVFSLFDILGPVTKLGFYIDDEMDVHSGFPIFAIAYFFYVGILTYVITFYRHHLYRQVYLGVMASIAVSIIVTIMQQRYGQASFTVATFQFPVFALLYLMHSSPYDVETGSVNEKAFNVFITTSYARHEELYLMSLYMHDFDGHGRKYPEEIQKTVRLFMTKFFKAPTLFQISGGHLILVVSKKKDPDYEKSGQYMLDEFNKVYPVIKVDYKIVFMGSYDMLNKFNDYVGFITYMHDRMAQNEFVRVTDDQVISYLNYKYIAEQLAEIQQKGDLDDPRVLVYCQPVYNLRSNTYDTAEALMRLQLPGIGMVFPDTFIPIAEKNKNIKTLTKIILAKTCKQIRKLSDEGYNVRRISVNFSIYDVRDDDFCDVIRRIVGESGIKFSQIAVELTESQNEQDFELIKGRLNELKGSGIKFYLDDFGTGYSNFERIMELPFDIVKFDRSLVIASGNNSRFRLMVSNLARMFADVDYAILYEGVENEEDEERCKSMSAKYLQGYKYSKPVPIERLTEFFEKAG